MFCGLYTVSGCKASFISHRFVIGVLTLGSYAKVFLAFVPLSVRDHFPQTCSISVSIIVLYILYPKSHTELSSNINYLL